MSLDIFFTETVKVYEQTITNATGIKEEVGYAFLFETPGYFVHGSAGQTKNVGYSEYDLQQRKKLVTKISLPQNAILEIEGKFFQCEECKEYKNILPHFESEVIGVLQSPL